MSLGNFGTIRKKIGRRATTLWRALRKEPKSRAVRHRERMSGKLSIYDRRCETPRIYIFVGGPCGHGEETRNSD